MRYYKKKGSDTHHWHYTCHHVPADVGGDPDWETTFSEPSGEECNQCKAKDK